MSPDDFAAALRAIDASLFLDDAGTETPLGVEYAATAADGAEVRVTRLASALTDGLRNPDAFVRTVERHGYLGAGIAGSTLYLVEGPRAGESLATWTAREGTIAPTALAPIAAAAATHLYTAVHPAGAHGFITPATLLVDEGRVALRWPGVVPGLLAAGADPALLAKRLGLAGYLAPEAAGGATLDVRGDVFALGATLFAATTGRPPFGGRTTALTMAAVLTDDAGASPGKRLTAAVLRAIERDPADRWSDARHFAEAIEEAPARRPGPSRSRTPRRHARTAVAAVAVGAVAYLLWRLSR